MKNYKIDDQPTDRQTDRWTGPNYQISSPETKMINFAYSLLLFNAKISLDDGQTDRPKDPQMYKMFALQQMCLFLCKSISRSLKVSAFFISFQFRILLKKMHSDYWRKPQKSLFLIIESLRKNSFVSVRVQLIIGGFFQVQSKPNFSKLTGPFD